MKKKVIAMITIFAFLILLAVVMLFPMKVRCGAPTYICGVPQGPDGKICHYYEIQPVGVTILEYINNLDNDFEYSSGMDCEIPSMKSESVQ